MDLTRLVALVFQRLLSLSVLLSLLFPPSLFLLLLLLLPLLIFLSVRTAIRGKLLSINDKRALAWNKTSERYPGRYRPSKEAQTLGKLSRSPRLLLYHEYYHLVGRVRREVVDSHHFAFREGEITGYEGHEPGS